MDPMTLTSIIDGAANVLSNAIGGIFDTIGLSRKLNAEKIIYGRDAVTNTTNSQSRNFTVVLVVLVLAVALIIIFSKKKS